MLITWVMLLPGKEGVSKKGMANQNVRERHQMGIYSQHIPPDSVEASWRSDPPAQQVAGGRSWKWGLGHLPAPLLCFGRELTMHYSGDIWTCVSSVETRKHYEDVMT